MEGDNISDCQFPIGDWESKLPVLELAIDNWHLAIDQTRIKGLIAKPS